MILYNQKDLPVELPDEAAKKIIELGGAKRGWTVKPSLKKPEPVENEIVELSQLDRKTLLEMALKIDPETKKNLSNAKLIEIISGDLAKNDIEEEIE